MLTDAQKVTLKADILANADTLAAYNIGNLDALEKAYNALASPAFIVWKGTLTSAEARAAISGGDGLAQLDNLTAGKRDSLLWVFDADTHPGNAAQRAAIEGLCGTQNMLKAAILAAQKRSATRLEKLFSIGTGSDASPATMALEGQVSYQEFIGL
jgi:hypothetical protein